MANKKPLPKQTPKSKAAPIQPAAPVTPIFPFSFNIKLIILAILSFVIYADTIGDGYCLDDGIVIAKNHYVQNGFGGIGKIMLTDAYDSYYKEMNAGQQLSGGRYRPLSEVVFAIEHTLFGESASNDIATPRHIVCVFFYILCILAMFYFLSKYLLKKFKYGEDMAFFATILFAIHPMHTEVVANVKSLDETLSMLFICLTFIFSLRYIDSKKTSDLVIGLVSFFLSLLAKEYAVTLLVLLPMLFYLVRNKSLGDSIMNSLPYFVVLAFYLFLRYKSVGFNGHIETNEILDNPYLLASHAQKIATELFVLGKYLWMLFVPYPLVSDYSYAQIPYQNPFSPLVVVTVLLYMAAVVWGLRLLIKRDVLAFPIFFYLFCLALVSNLVMDIGATMGERLIFHSSLGFVILISYGLFTLTKKWDIQKRRSLIFGLTSILVIVFGYETMARNLDWKSDLKLFTHDVTIGPNSTMLNGNAGARYIDLAQRAKDGVDKKNKLDTAIIYLKKSIFLHKRTAYVSSYLNLGDAYYELKMPDSAEIYWKIVKSAYPNYPNLDQYFALLGKLYFDRGAQYGAQHNYGAAIGEMYKGVAVDPKETELWYNIGVSYFAWGKYDSAAYAWNKTLQINPNHAQAKNALANLAKLNKK